MTSKTYSRRDLDALKAMDRAEIFAALRSFDHTDMDDSSFALAVVDLLDAGAVPGLTDAASAGNAEAVGKAVLAACVARIDENEPPQEAVAVGKLDASVAAAREVLANRFTFYDEAHQLPDDIDWDHNPGTAHWGHDLNRFGYLRPLVVAWRETKDQAFARKIVDLILDWNTKCPWHRMFTATPYVFGSYLNQAIHIREWATVVEQLLPAGIVKPVELLRILKSLHDQLVYLEIVTNGHHGNWPTIGCMGMLGVVGTLPVLRDTNHLADYCINTLAEQIDEQVLPDGVQDELTPHYHRVVINNLLSALDSLRRINRSLADRTLETLERMVHYAEQMRTPDRSAQVAFSDSDPDAVADFEPRLRKLGLEPMIAKPENLGPERFPYAGVALLRQRADEGDLYLAFDGGPFGRSHQHEDMLGFWLFAHGRSFIVDPGRHLYDGSEKSYLAYLRSTRAHSTIRIDGQDQHARGKPQTWIAEKPVPLTFAREGCEVYGAAQYDLGYGDDNAINVTHRREITLLCGHGWVMFDHVIGEGEHEVESRFQFAPKANLKVEDNRVSTGYDDANLMLWSLPATPWQKVTVAEGDENPRGGWYSGRYGLIEPAPCLIQTTTVKLPLTVATLLWPYKGATPGDVKFAFDGEVATLDSEATGNVRVSPRQA